MGKDRPRSVGVPRAPRGFRRIDSGKVRRGDRVWVMDEWQVAQEAIGAAIIHGSWVGFLYCPVARRVRPAAKRGSRPASAWGKRS